MESMQLNIGKYKSELEQSQEILQSTLQQQNTLDSNLTESQKICKILETKNNELLSSIKILQDNEIKILLLFRGIL